MAVLIIGVVGLVVAGVLVNNAARKATERQAALVSASAAHAMTWVQILAEGNGLFAPMLSCDAVMERYPDVPGAGLQNAFEHFLGGRPAEARVDHVDVVDGSYYVTFDGTLDGGDPVAFVVEVIGEHSRWAACGFGTPDQVS